MRDQTRNYTTEFHRIHASFFKSLFEREKNLTYRIDIDWLSESHQTFHLKKITDKALRLEFSFDNRKVPVILISDSRGVATRHFVYCPYCGKLKKHLYVATNTYACRNCLQLNYPSQSESEIDRIGRKIRKARRRIWGKDYEWLDYDSLFECSAYWPKPTGKHHNRFDHERKELEALENQFNEMVYARFGQYL